MPRSRNGATTRNPSRKNPSFASIADAVNAVTNSDRAVWVEGVIAAGRAEGHRIASVAATAYASALQSCKALAGVGPRIRSQPP